MRVRITDENGMALANEVSKSDAVFSVSRWVDRSAPCDFSDPKVIHKLGAEYRIARGTVQFTLDGVQYAVGLGAYDELSDDNGVRLDFGYELPFARVGGQAAIKPIIPFVVLTQP